MIKLSSLFILGGICQKEALNQRNTVILSEEKVVYLLTPFGNFNFGVIWRKEVSLNTWLLSNTNLIANWLDTSSCRQSLQSKVVISTECKSVAFNFVRK